MKIIIISVGKIQKDYFKRGVTDFITRLKHYIGVELVTVKEEKIGTGKSGAEILRAEARRITEVVHANAITLLIALERSGEQWSSEGLAKFLADKMNRSTKTIGFVVGGPLGLDQSVLETATLRLSLSHLTFLHEMSLLILAEQLYRAFTILSGEKYHK